MLKSKFPNLQKSILTIVIAVIGSFILMVLAYCLPTQRIRNNVHKDHDRLEAEGTYYQWKEGYKSNQADGYTDASLYMNAMYEGGESVVQDAMNTPRYLYEDNDDNWTSMLKYAAGDPLGDSAVIIDYGRYWHGSVVFLKVLLQVMSVMQLRILGAATEILLTVLCIFFFCKRGYYKHLLGFVTGLVLLNPVTMITCFCFSVEYILMLAATLFVLRNHEKMEEKNAYAYFFLIVGLVTEFLNELSFPMITFAFPVLVYLILSKKDPMTRFKNLILYGINWVAGYGILWGSKWVYGEVLTDNPFLSNAFMTVNVYTLDYVERDATNPGVIARIMRNLKVYMNLPFLVIGVFVIALLVAIILLERKRASGENENKLYFYDAFPILIMILFPFAIWIALGSGYSYMHYWMTHRLLAIAGFAFVSGILVVFDKKNSGNNKHEVK